MNDYSIKNKLENFLFAPTNPTCVAVFRIALAVAIATFFYPNNPELLFRLQDIPGLYYIYDQIFLTHFYWFLILITLIPFGVGWKSSIMGFLIVGLLLPLDFVNRGSHSRQIILFTLFAFSFLKSNKKTSLINKPEVFASAGPMWPIRLIQIQLSAVYGVNAVAKTTPEYLSGDVLVVMSQTLPNFLVDLSDGYLHLGFLSIPVVLAAISTVAVEHFLAIGFWFRFIRPLVAAVGLIFHLILAKVVSIYMFDWACIFLYLSFLLPFDRITPHPDPLVYVREKISDFTKALNVRN